MGFFGMSQPTIFLSFIELSRNQQGKIVSEKMDMLAAPDLQSCGTSPQWLIRCDNLEKNFLTAPCHLQPKLLAPERVSGQAGELWPEGREPDPGSK